MQQKIEKLRYLWWALKHTTDRDRTCPSCGQTATQLLRRKKWVTSLWECATCGLRFRIPKNTLEETRDFYQTRYQADFATYIPTDEALQKLVGSSFRGTEGDYSHRIEVVRAAGLRSGDSILDFGSSWGYGSWQYQQAGFKVYSYEISQTRARFAAGKLGCEMISNLETWNNSVDCVHSCHVIEHLPDPNIWWRVATQKLRPGGKVICFAPNGEPQREQTLGVKVYDRYWGRVHPLLITARSLIAMATRFNFEARVYTTPYPLDAISHFTEVPTSQLGGEEILCYAVKGN